jgi:hypothetical protein
MFMFVQGRTDASRKWGELIESFIFDVLGLVPNRADPCTYLGTYKNHPVIYVEPLMIFFSSAKISIPMTI